MTKTKHIDWVEHPDYSHTVEVRVMSDGDLYINDEDYTEKFIEQCGVKTLRIAFDIAKMRVKLGVWP